LFESYLDGNSLGLWLSPNMTVSKSFSSFVLFSCWGFFGIHFM